MAVNELKVNQQHAIAALDQQGWSKRKIARELGVDRSAVRRYLAGTEAKPPTPPQTGSEVNHPAAAVASPAPASGPAGFVIHAELRRIGDRRSVAAIASGALSKCAP